jgi:hypothetical protein
MSTFTQLHEILYTHSQDMLVLSSSVASCYLTTVQMAMPVPEIMDSIYVVTEKSGSSTYLKCGNLQSRLPFSSFTKLLLI